MTTILRYPPGSVARRLIDSYINKLATSGPLATAPGRGQANPVAESSVSAEAAAWFNSDPDPAKRALIQARIDVGGFWAWRAQASVGSPWPNAPADYAASLVSVEGNAVSLSENNGIVPWAAATGWGHVAAQQKSFDTGVIPANDQSGAMLIQFANHLAANGFLASLYNGVANTFFQVFAFFGGNHGYSNGGTSSIAGGLTDGNIAIVGSQGYLNGVVDGATVAAWGGASALSIFIGARSTGGVAGFWCTSEVSSIILCDDATAILPSLASLAALPNGSMHNL